MYQEFFTQGDVERSMGLEVSFGCDRRSVRIPSSVIFLIDNYILSEMKNLISIFPKMNLYKEQVLKNREEWDKLASRPYELKST